MHFECPGCKQPIKGESSLAGKEIQCPSCNHTFTVPKPETSKTEPKAPPKGLPPKVDKKFKVPVYEKKQEALIEHTVVEEEFGVKGEREIRIKTIKRMECIEVGRDNFDAVVSKLLGKSGEENVISIHPLNYTGFDSGSQKYLTDYAVMIVFRG